MLNYHKYDVTVMGVNEQGETEPYVEDFTITQLEDYDTGMWIVHDLNKEGYPSEFFEYHGDDVVLLVETALNATRTARKFGHA